MTTGSAPDGVRSEPTARPAIVVVDDEQASLQSLARELGKRYGADYQVVREASAVAALERLREFKRAGQEVAVVLADQWMPEMTGVDLLARTHQIHHTARRALLITWGDRAAAEPILRASALGHIHYYHARLSNCMGQEVS